MKKTEYFPLRGGLNLVDPALTVPPGTAKFMLNYEVDVNGGYRSAAGYERFDGRDKPSDAVFIGFDYEFVAAGDPLWLPGDVVTGGTSGASGTIYSAAIQDQATGEYVDVVDGTEYTPEVGVTQRGTLTFVTTTLVFQQGETITGPDHTATLYLGPSDNYGATNTQRINTLIAAQAVPRALIEAVPGVGPVRGFFTHDGEKYALRDDDAYTKTLYVATAGGWSAVDLGQIVYFDAGGTTPIVVGDTVNDPSLNTSTVRAVILQSGTWAGSDAAGYLILDGNAVFANNDDIDVATVLRATADGASADQTLIAGGRGEYISHNFYGATNRRRIYGCDGVNNAFEFDGTAYVPIVTGMVQDYPEHIAAHKGRLWLSFIGGSTQYSSVAMPTEWSPILGAGELGLGDEVTALWPTVEVLFIIGRNKFAALYADEGTPTFTLKDISQDTGARPWTIQDVGDPIFLDDRGLCDVRSTQRFGNFIHGTISQQVAPFLLQRLDLAVASLIVKERSLYRLFFSDGSALSLTFGDRGKLGYGQQQYLISPFVAWSGEGDNGREEVFVGCDDGFVYQMEIGISFDGADIETSLRLAFSHSNSPRQRKKYSVIEFEMVAPIDLALRIQPEFKYGSGEYPASEVSDVDVMGGGAFWDGDVWDGFNWSSQTVATARGRIDGVAPNVSTLIYGNQTAPPHIMQGATLHYIPVRQER